eukprot:CAMPEP_0184487430 /NCGR_PEP_ID=MMETSP0113_2-20130426/10082_1 /TAXON_ID=91329 /ORGANISM="Norrisiella sphaerica, Strain BC52" /LENGTH=272 /DNA_ID=CAMNT_0026869749 /DNA_START=126 /DNA_END=944 /DNA_ORIENTATION=+
MRDYIEIGSRNRGGQKMVSYATVAALAMVGCFALAFAYGEQGLLEISPSVASTRMNAMRTLPSIMNQPIERLTKCAAGKNHLRKTTKTLEKVDMPTDITILGPDPLQRKSYYPKLADTKAAKETWFVVDAKDQVLGRLSTLVATLVMGKWHPLYHPAMNMGGNVVIINADKVRVTGRKYTDKMYKRHVTGRPGSMKTESFRDLQARIPERIVEIAIKGMLPKTRLGRAQFKQVHVYAGEDHPHGAQKPVDMTYKISKGIKDTYMQDRELTAN